MVAKIKKSVEVAIKQLEQRIDEGEYLLGRYRSTDLASHTLTKQNLNLLDEDTENWHRINQVILGQMFDTREYVNEYERNATYHPPLIRVVNRNPSFRFQERSRFPGQRSFEPPPLPPPHQKPSPVVFVEGGLRNLRSVLAQLPHLERGISTTDIYIAARKRLNAMNYSDIDHKRFEFLMAVYDATGGSKSSAVSIWKIGESLGLSRDDTGNITDYLTDEGLIVVKDVGTFVGMTHQGIKEVEAAKNEPQKATEHFSTQIINNFHAPVTNAAFQQGNQNSTQNVNMMSQAVPELEDWLDQMESVLSTLDSVGAEAKRGISNNIAAVRAELEDPDPDPGIIKKSLERVRSFGWAVAEHATAAKLLEALPAMIVAVEHLKHIHP